MEGSVLIAMAQSDLHLVDVPRRSIAGPASSAPGRA